MIDDIQDDANDRMGKSVESLEGSFAKIRTGRANPSLLDTILVEYYGNDTPLNQIATITVEDARTLAISPWEKSLVPDIEKAILKSDIGITPASTGDLIRVPLPALTEENRRDLARQAKQEAEKKAKEAVAKLEKEQKSQEDKIDQAAGAVGAGASATGASGSKDIVTEGSGMGRNKPGNSEESEDNKPTEEDSSGSDDQGEGSDAGSDEGEGSDESAGSDEQGDGSDDTSSDDNQSAPEGEEQN